MTFILELMLVIALLVVTWIGGAIYGAHQTQKLNDEWDKK